VTRRIPEGKRTGRGNKVCFREPAKLRRKGSSSQIREDNISAKTWQNLVSQARALLAYSLPLAEEVRDGIKRLDAA